MKLAKKLLSVVLTLCMMLSLLPAVALADEPDINYLLIHTGGPATPYAALAAAVENAVAGDTIQAQGNVNEEYLTSVIAINKKLTLDLNNHTVALSAPSITILSILAGGSLTVENGTLNVGTSGTVPTIAVDGGSLTIAEENPAKINIGAMKNGLTVTGGGEATVTSVTTSGEGGAAVSAVGVSASDVDDPSRATVLGDVNVALESESASLDGTYGVVAKAGAAIEVGGNISLNIIGVANQTDCAAAWATGYSGTYSQGTQSKIYVDGNVSATSSYGGAYGATADNGGYVDVAGNASAKGVGTIINTSTGECEDMVAAAATRDSGSYVYVSNEVTATGEKNAFGGVSSGGYVSFSGKTDVFATGADAFACGAASYGSGGSTYIAGDITVSASDNGSTTIGGHALAGGRVELWDLLVTSSGSAFGIVADGKSLQGFASNACAQAKVTYSGDASSAGAWAKNGGTARVNGYFTEEVATPVIQVNNNVAPTRTTPDAYDTYADTDGSVVFIIGLGKIVGTVTDIDGSPLKGVTVWAYDEHFSVVTDANGQYSIDPMPLYQPNCWATAEISEDISREVNPFTRSMERGSTTTVDFTNTSALFAETYDSSLLNDTATLGLQGTNATSDDVNVVRAFAYEKNIRLTSVGAGSATVTVTDASSKTATIAVTVDAHGYLTIRTITKYTAPSSNNDSSPSNGGPITTTTPITNVSGSTATTTVTPTVSGGVATGSVTADQMSDAMKKAQAAAGPSGTPNVTIKISGASGASSVGMSIPHASLQSLVSSGVGALTISGPTGSLNFDADALKTISDASGDVKVTIAKTDSSTLSDAARTLVGSHPVFTFSVTSGGSAISQFDGDVTVSVPYTLAAGEDPNAVVIYYIAADGTPTPVQETHYDTATGTVTFTTTHFSTYAVGYKKVSFADVANKAWYADAVTFLAARGITSGTTATTFSPDTTLTRGQFITMLLQAYGVAAVTNSTDNFSDAGSTYYTGYLAAAKKLGITSGVGNNKFAPDQSITRQEMFTLLYNALKVIDKLPSGASGKTLADFSDAGSVAYWANDAIMALVKAGTVSGSNGKLNPTGTTMRAEMAQVLYNLLAK